MRITDLLGKELRKFSINDEIIYLEENFKIPTVKNKKISQVFLTDKRLMVFPLLVSKLCNVFSLGSHASVSASVEIHFTCQWVEEKLGSLQYHGSYCVKPWKKSLHFLRTKPVITVKHFTFELSKQNGRQ